MGNTNRFGYCCINLTLKTVNRTMRYDTFAGRGLRYVSELALKNCEDLERMVKWNSENNISVFRISSEIFPWQSEYEFDQLPRIDEIRAILERIGEFCKAVNQRLSFHPGPFTCLGSDSDSVCEKSAKELRQHSEIMDMLKQPKTVEAKINIHIGGGNKHEKWCKNFQKLPESVRSRITVENDDKPNAYSTKMLYDLVYKEVGSPIVFDSHHFQLGKQDSDYNEAIEMAVSTWPKGIRPMCHHSNSRQLEEKWCRESAHSDYYYTPFRSNGYSVDVALECKAKELGLIKYLKDFGE